MMTTNPEEIILYGTTWCGESYRAKAFLKRNNVPFRFVDIDQDADGRAFVVKTNNGFRSVPTLVFPDGSVLVEPSESQLAAKLGIGVS
jgi:mycoredoxin